MPKPAGDHRDERACEAGSDDSDIVVRAAFEAAMDNALALSLIHI